MKRSIAEAWDLVGDEARLMADAAATVAEDHGPSTEIGRRLHALSLQLSNCAIEHRIAVDAETAGELARGLKLLIAAGDEGSRDTQRARALLKAVRS